MEVNPTIPYQHSIKQLRNVSLHTDPAGCWEHDHISRFLMAHDQGCKAPSFPLSCRSPRIWFCPQSGCELQLQSGIKKRDCDLSLINAKGYPINTTPPPGNKTILRDEGTVMAYNSFDSHNLMIDFGFGINNSVIHVFSGISGNFWPAVLVPPGSDQDLHLL